MTLTQSIIATLSYHDVFNYPLTQEEILKYLILRKTNVGEVKRGLKSLLNAKLIGIEKDYYYLRNRKRIVKIRLYRKKQSIRKLKKAKYFSKILKIIPTIKLLAITGALSMENSSKIDDIDLMIVTTKNNLWTTRLLANLALIFYKRNPNSQKKVNRACLNIFVDEKYLLIKDQNLYIAHEIAQIKVLWAKDGLDKKFFKANIWIKRYLPNFNPEIGELEKNTLKVIFPKVIEKFCKYIQKIYMKSKITTEEIGDRQLFFHPSATKSEIIKIYNQKLSKLKISKSRPTIDNK